MKTTIARRTIAATAAATLPLFAATGVADAQTPPAEAPPLGSIPSEVTGPLMPVLEPLVQSVGQPLVFAGMSLFWGYCSSAMITNPFACA